MRFLRVRRARGCEIDNGLAICYKAGVKTIVAMTGDALYSMYNYI